MKIVYTPQAEEQVDKMDTGIRRLFFKHIEKIVKLPLKRPLRFGIPFNVEEVTHQARLVYEFENDACYIIRCFSIHKEYEKWYKSYK